MEEDENLEIPFGIDALKIVKQSPRGLDELYEQMMKKIERGRDQDQQRSKDILSAMVLVQRPLDLFELDVLAGLHADKDVATIEKMVKRCGSYLMVAEQKVSFIHQSAKDYVQGCYKTRIQPDGMGCGHEDLVSRSIKAMSQGLSQNLYKLSYDTEAKSLVVPEPEPLASYEYSCVFWMNHLSCQICETISPRKEPNNYSDILGFLETHFLVWLESMSLLGEISHGLVSIRNLLAVIPRQPPTNNQLVPDRVCQTKSGLIEILTDFERFVSRNASVIAVLPLQIYASALLFSPKTSKIRRLQWGKRLNFIEDVSGIMKTWGPCRFTLDESDSLFMSAFNSVVFSPNGKLFASNPNGSNIRLYDTAAGIPAIVLLSDNAAISVSFSPDSEFVLTAHRDDSLRLWTTATGECKRVLPHADTPYLAKFSPSGRIFASVSTSAIKIWDTSTAALRQVLQIPIQVVVGSMLFLGCNFSPDDQLLAALTENCRIYVWNTSSGELVDMAGDERIPDIIKFWPDGKILSGSHERNELWELENDGLKMLATHEQKDNDLFAEQTLSQFISAHSSSNGHEFHKALAEAPRAMLQHFYHSALCPHGKLLATVAPRSETELSEITLWDVSEGKLVQSLRGHPTAITAVAFSPDGQKLASSSEDGQVMLWDTLVNASKDLPEDQLKQPGYVVAVVFSHSGQVLATATKDQARNRKLGQSIRLWDIKSGRSILTFEVSWRELSNILAIDFDSTDAMLVSVHPKEIMFWDCATGELRHVLDMPTLQDQGRALFSPNGKHFVTTCDGRYSNLEVQHFATTTRESDWSVVLPDNVYVFAWGFSPDSKLLVVSWGWKLVVWDVDTGVLQGAVDRLPMKQCDQREYIPDPVAVSSGGETIVCKKWNHDKTIQLWNVQDGTLTHEFEVEYNVRKLSFSADGRYINAGLGRICLDCTYKDCSHIPSGSVSIISEEIGGSGELEDWIVKDWRKIIRLPADRSATTAACSHGCLVVGHKSGDVTFVKLKKPEGSTR